MQHLLLVMLEKRKKALDNGKNVCTIFMDLSETRDTINYGLLLAKLESYALKVNVLKLTCSYLKYWLQAL